MVGRQSPTAVQITIKQSKTDPSMQLYLGNTEARVCPVKALLAYLAVRDAIPGPCFKLENKQGLTWQKFSARLSTTLAMTGALMQGYTTHSFRIGAAPTAKEAGVSDVHIKIPRRWKSGPYQLYAWTPKQSLARLSRQLATVGKSV